MAGEQPKKPVGGAYGVFMAEKRPEFAKAWWLRRPPRLARWEEQLGRSCPKRTRRRMRRCFRRRRRSLRRTQKAAIRAREKISYAPG
eukprot:g16165.t1